MENNRYTLELVGAENNSAERANNTWMLSYLDMLTLLIAFFVLLLSMSELRSDRLADPAVIIPDVNSTDATTAMDTIAVTGGAGILPDNPGVLPGHDGVLLAEVISPADRPDSADDESTDNTGIDDSYDGRFGDIEDSLNALALQGVDATPGREGLTLRIADNLLFESGEAELLYDGMMLMRSLIGILDTFIGEISIEGHTDNVPINTTRFPSNWELSSARAISVLRFLELDGLSADRMRAVGYADTRPLQSNETPEVRAGNRRVELILREP